MGKRLALIIGNSLYRDDKLTRLVAPDADVGALKDALQDPELGGFDEVNLVFNSASYIVRREIYTFFANKTSADMLLFYFSGHGVLDEYGKLYLAVKDTATEALRGTAIPARYITEEMDNSRSKRQVLILDCCHSGAFERGTKGVTGASVGTATTFEGSGYGRVILTASDATQYAWEGNQVIGEAENSLFTHYIIEGIRTGAADTNQDGNITVDEIYDYAFTQIRDKTSKQVPGKWSFKEQGEMIISKNPEIDAITTPLISEEDSMSIEVGDTVDEEVQKTKKLEQLYNNLISKMLVGDYTAAKEIIFDIQKIDKKYKDTESMFLKINTLIEEDGRRLEKEKADRERIAKLTREAEKRTQTASQPIKEVKGPKKRNWWIWGVVLVLIVYGIYSMSPGPSQPIEPPMAEITNTPTEDVFTTEDAIREAENQSVEWIDTTFGSGDIEKLVSLSPAPFYFVDTKLLSEDEIRSVYNEIMSDVPDPLPTISIGNLISGTVANFYQSGFILDDPQSSPIFLDHAIFGDDIVVYAPLKWDDPTADDITISFYFRIVDDTVEMLGLWSY